MSFDSRLNAPQTPQETVTLGPVRESLSESHSKSESHSTVTLEVPNDYDMTVEFHKAAKINPRVTPLFVTYAECRRLERIKPGTLTSRIRIGRYHPEPTGEERRNAERMLIPFIDLSPLARQRWESEQLGAGQGAPRASERPVAQTETAAPCPPRNTVAGAELGAPGDAPNGGQADPGMGDLARSAPAPIHEEHVRTSAGGAAATLLGGAPQSGPHELCPARQLSPAPPAHSLLAPYKEEHVRADSLATLNPDGIPVLKSDPRAVWEAGLPSVCSPRALEEFYRRRRIVVALEIAQSGAGWGGRLDAARAVAAQHDLASWRTLLTWQALYREQGDPGLVPRQRGLRESKAIPRRLAGQIEAYYAQGASHHDADRPTLAQCHRWAASWCNDILERTGEFIPVPSYFAIRRLLDRICRRRPMLLSAARHGRDRHSDAFEFHVTRDPLALALGECFCLDHRIMDTHVISPSGARIVRPWLSAIIDIHSADFVGWVLRERVTSDGVASAFRRAIMGFALLDPATGEWIEFPAHGVPQRAYLDHGKEFHGGPMAQSTQARGGRFSKTFSHTPKDLPLDQAVSETLFSALHIQRVTAIRYSARSKPIEPIFGSFATRVENLIAGHCGRNTLDKPQQLKERRTRGELLGWNDYLIVLARAIQDWRHERGIGDRPKSPAEFWENWQGDLPDPARLDTLLLRKDAKRVGSAGIEILWGKDEYHYLSADPEFAGTSGGYLPTLCTPDDREAVLVILPSGRRLTVPRVDLQGHSWDLMRGLEMPEAQKLVKRAAGVQRALATAYTRWASSTRAAADLDPTGSLRIAAQNGREIRSIEREIRRDSAPAPAPARAAPRLSSLQSHYANAVADDDPLGLNREAAE